MLDPPPKVTIEPRDYAVKITASIAETIPGKEPHSSRHYEVVVSKEYPGATDWNTMLKEVGGKAARALLELKIAHRSEAAATRTTVHHPTTPNG